MYRCLLVITTQTFTKNNCRHKQLKPAFVDFLFKVCKILQMRLLAIVSVLNKDLEV